MTEEVDNDPLLQAFIELEMNSRANLREYLYDDEIDYIKYYAEPPEFTNTEYEEMLECDEESSFNDDGIPDSERELLSSYDEDGVCGYSPPLTVRKRELIQRLLISAPDEEDSGLNLSVKEDIRNECLFNFKDYILKKRAIKAYKRLQKLAEANANNSEEEAAFLQDLELKDKKINGCYYYEEEEPPAYKKLLMKRKKAVKRKYELYALDPDYREELFGRTLACVQNIKPDGCNAVQNRSGEKASSKPPEEIVSINIESCDNVLRIQKKVSSLYDDRILDSEQEFIKDECVDQNISHPEPQSRRLNKYKELLYEWRILPNDNEAEQHRKYLKKVEVMDQFRDFQNRQRAIKAMNRVEAVEKLNLGCPIREAEVLVRMETVDKKLHKNYYYAEHEPEECKAVLRLRVGAIIDKYVLYAHNAAFRAKMKKKACDDYNMNNRPAPLFDNLVLDDDEENNQECQRDIANLSRPSYDYDLSISVDPHTINLNDSDDECDNRNANAAPPLSAKINPNTFNLNSDTDNECAYINANLPPSLPPRSPLPRAQSPQKQLTRARRSDSIERDRLIEYPDGGCEEAYQPFDLPNEMRDLTVMGRTELTGHRQKERRADRGKAGVWPMARESAPPELYGQKPESARMRRLSRFYGSSIAPERLRQNQNRLLGYQACAHVKTRPNRDLSIEINSRTINLNVDSDDEDDCINPRPAERPQCNFDLSFEINPQTINLNADSDDEHDYINAKPAKKSKGDFDDSDDYIIPDLSREMPVCNFDYDDTDDEDDCIEPASVPSKSQYIPGPPPGRRTDSIERDWLIQNPFGACDLLCKPFDISNKWAHLTLQDGSLPIDHRQRERRAERGKAGVWPMRRESAPPELYGQKPESARMRRLSRFYGSGVAPAKLRQNQNRLLGCQ